MIITLVGTLWVGVSGDFGRLLQLRLGSGEILILLANLSMAVYTVALKRSSTALAPLSFMALITLIGTLALLPFMYLEGGFAAGLQPYLRHLGAITYIGVIAGGAAYALWNESVLRNGANLTGLSLYAQPAFAIVFSWYFLGEAMRPYHWQGLALLVTGIALIIFGGGIRASSVEPA
jgi:drug/metabolite transporter (DMT)-like permease